MEYFIDQKDFYKNLDLSKFKDFENNLCWIINVFIILRNLWLNIWENEILEQSLKIKAYDNKKWWIYQKLIDLLKYYLNENNIEYNKIEIFDTKFFHKFRLKNLFRKFGNTIFIASVKMDENHLIIIDKVINKQIFYKSVWTSNSDANKNWVIEFDDFFRTYNKRWIVISLK